MTTTPYTDNGILHVDALASALADGGPADAALGAWQHSLGLLADAQRKVEQLTAPGVAARAEAEDTESVIQAASQVKPAPKATAVPKHETDLATARRVGAALETLVHRHRAEALAAVGADAERRLDMLDQRRAEIDDRLHALADEMSRHLAEVTALDAHERLLAVLADGEEPTNKNVRPSKARPVLGDNSTLGSTERGKQQVLDPTRLLAGLADHATAEPLAPREPVVFEDGEPAVRPRRRSTNRGL